MFYNDQLPPKKISYDIIKKSIKNIFDKIKSSKGSSFEVSEATSVMNALDCESIKSSSNNKADIILAIHDYITLIETEIGFSIKSSLGSNPTLLNASQATNFIYQIYNDNKKSNFDSLAEDKKIKEFVKSIISSDCIIEYSKIQSEIFNKNLRKIDSLMPVILSEFILNFYKGNGVTIKDLSLSVASSDIIQKLDFNYEDIKFKIKNLLLNIALGMVPNTLWDGFMQAGGGYIIVKENGEIVCYHIYNIQQFSEYLFNNTKLETPSTTRHKFGSIYIEEGNYYIKLNCQIRFT